MSYAEYLASSTWATKRQQRLALDAYRCCTCHHDGSVYPLQVHHATYERLFDEDVDNDLITLCAVCHAAITNIMRNRRYIQRRIKVDLLPTTTRVEIMNDGMERSHIQVDWIGPASMPLRADGRSDEQVCQVDETDFWQAQQNRR